MLRRGEVQVRIAVLPCDSQRLSKGRSGLAFPLTESRSGGNLLGNDYITESGSGGGLLGNDHVDGNFIGHHALHILCCSKQEGARLSWEEIAYLAGCHAEDTARGIEKFAAEE